MPRVRYSGSDKGRLRWLLGLFFVALTIPSVVLTWQAYSRLKWETFHQYQALAEEMLGRVDRRMREMIEREEARAFTDYRFLVVEGPPTGRYPQRSPLSGYPVSSDIPGLLGYFQLDADGRFTTPLLPDGPGPSAPGYGLDDAELQERRALRERLLAILSQQAVTTAGLPHDAPVEDGSSEGMAVVERGTRPFSMESARPEALVERSSPAAAAPGAREGRLEKKEQALAQATFDRLNEESTRQRELERPQASVGNIGHVDELRLDRAYDAEEAPARRPFSDFKKRMEIDVMRRERDAAKSAPDAAPALAEADPVPDGSASSPELARIFESEVDPFAFDAVGGGHFVLYRKVWRDGRRYIQGAVIEKVAFLQALIEMPFRETPIAAMSRLGIAFDGDILSALAGQRADRYLSRSEELSGTLLYRGRLSTPLDRLELIFTVTSMPTGGAGRLVIWVALTLGLVLTGGLILMYRLGAKQLELNRQQRDFVSAVSHELKTPLTSIRMYSEMLREGWADEARKRSYYDFIHDESERLSRLISNVLQLARLGRDELRVEPRPVGVQHLMEKIESRVSTQVGHAGFELSLNCAEDAARQRLEVDEDAFVQVMINLVDNAIKFSAQAERKAIDIACAALSDGRIEFRVRDYGPGIPRDQMKKIFVLFYRTENELTRETVGTGIGLALVQRLTTAMGGEVDAVNREPGAEFRVRFPGIAAQ